MKSYPFLVMPVLLAIMLPLIITSCKKEAKPDLQNKSVITGTPEHKTVVLWADENALRASNTEINLGIRNGNTNASVYPVSELDVFAWTVQGQPVTMRSLIKFYGIPSLGTPPTAAYLTLFSHPDPSNGDQIHANYGTNNAFYIRRVTNTWTPTTTTWFNQPATTTVGQVLVPHTNDGYRDLLQINVTQIVRDCFTSGNYGFLLQLQNESTYNSRIFRHSADADFSKRPYLTLVF